MITTTVNKTGQVGKDTPNKDDRPMKIIGQNGNHARDFRKRRKQGVRIAGSIAATSRASRVLARFV